MGPDEEAPRSLRRTGAAEKKPSLAMLAPAQVAAQGADPGEPAPLLTSAFVGIGR